MPGTGLGLPTAKAITELHGGRIEVTSVVGTGHHVHGLPADRAMTAVPPLVIEDEPDVAGAIRAVLESGGLRGADRGRRPGRAPLLPRRPPGLVLLDVGLPVLDGWDVLDRIRELSDVPVLMLTSHGLEAEKVRGLRAGADDFVTKPFSNAELLARVQALLRRGPARPGRAGRGRDLTRTACCRWACPTARSAWPTARCGLTPDRVPAAGVPWSGTRTRCCRPEQLLDQVWQDPAGVGPDRVKFTVMRLRRKLGQYGGSGPPIEAVRGLRLPLPPAR